MADSTVGSSTDRNYTNIFNGTSTNKTNGTFDAVFSNEDNTTLGVQDFFSLMVAQLTNQDFMNPTDDTQYLAQLAQFSSLTAMQELSQYSKQNYIMGMLGKDCTAATYNIGGEVEQTTGKVTSVSLVDNDYKLTINGKQFSMSEIMTVNEGSSSDTTTEDKEEDKEA